jgi:hypothetical protein
VQEGKGFWRRWRSFEEHEDFEEQSGFFKKDKVPTFSQNMWGILGLWPVRGGTGLWPAGWRSRVGLCDYYRCWFSGGKYQEEGGYGAVGGVSGGAGRKSAVGVHAGSGRTACPRARHEPRFPQPLGARWPLWVNMFVQHSMVTVLWTVTKVSTPKCDTYFRWSSSRVGCECFGY